MFAGPPPLNPDELIISETMRDVLRIASEEYELVIIDTPPTAVSDAVPLISEVSGVLVVARLEQHDPGCRDRSGSPTS